MLVKAIVFQGCSRQQIKIFFQLQNAATSFSSVSENNKAGFSPWQAATILQYNMQSFILKSASIVSLIETALVVVKKSCHWSCF